MPLEATSLIATVLESSSRNEDRLWSEGEIRLIWAKVGGNPLALKLAAQNLAFGVLNADTAGILTSLYDHVYAGLSMALRRTWVLFSLLPIAGLDNSLLQDLCLENNIVMLLRYHILEGITSKPSLSTSARQYVRGNQTYREEIDAFVNGWLVEFDRCIESDPMGVLPIIEHLLFTNRPGVDYNRQQRWVSALWRYGFQQGHGAVWCAILERFNQQSPAPAFRLEIAYGICLRRLSDWTEAQSVFEKLVQEAGRTGHFIEQAQAQLELAVLFRYRGNYREAMLRLAQAERTILRFKDDALREVLRVEQAQIALDRGQGESAQAYLLDCTEKTGPVLALESEAYILTSEFERAYTQAMRALNLLADDNAATASVHTILGRSYDQRNDLERAHRHLAISLTLLEPLQNAFALARAQSNLGALLLREGAYEEAKTLLAQAEYTQAVLGDQVALTATRHNLLLAHARISG